MKTRFLRQAERAYSPESRAVMLLLAGVVFLVTLPRALAVFSRRLDRRCELPKLEFGIANPVLGSGFVVAGILLGWWSNYVQFTVGRGTPVPIMATQELIVEKPYSYCRNPMALGAIVAYLGVAILLGSISALFLVLVGAAVLLVYIKVLEEREMELRFGDAYRVYRNATPFILPQMRRRK